MCFVQDNPNTFHLIWAIKDRYAPDKFMVKIGVGIKDPFAPKPAEECGLAVVQCVGENGLVNEISNNLPKWNINDLDKAFQAVQKYAFIWFDKNLQLTNLILYLEHRSQDTTHASKANLLNSLAEKLFFRQQGISKPPNSVPPIHNYYLSLLYYHKKDWVASRSYLQLWLDYLNSRPIAFGEPARSLKQFQYLSDNIAQLS